MTSKRKKRIKIVTMVLIMIIILVNIATKKPVRLSTDGIEKIFVAVEINTDRLTYGGHATVTKQSDMEDVIKTLNGIRVFRLGNYSVDDLEGDSPTAWIMLYDSDGEVVDSVDFHQDILSYDGFYKISMSEYDKLIKICNDYGESQE